MIATIGITHGQKTVSPSRNPSGSDSFSVANSQSSTSVAKLFAFMGPTSIIIFRAEDRTEELGLYQNSLASQRSILEHVSICSPSQFVHLHGKPYRLFFEQELDGTAPISLRVIATIGITHGRKTVSPSRNPSGSDPFLVANSQSSTSVAKLFAFMGPTPIFLFRAGAQTEELGPYQNSLASQRSVLEHVSICSPSQLVHLHGKPYRLFFERELDGTAPISLRVIATIGITHGRKTVSPSRNPCDSDPFLVANSQSSTSVAKLFAFMGPTLIICFGPELERNRINWDRSPVPCFFIYRRASACC